jgi:hypothetical protein
MQHPTFAKHPIGEFDVEHFINDFRNGKPAHELSRCPDE